MQQNKLASQEKYFWNHRDLLDLYGLKLGLDCGYSVIIVA